VGHAAFGVGQPPVDAFPLEVWSRLVARHARLGDRTLLRYGRAMGYEPLREAVAEYLRTARGVRCEAAQIMIVSGSQAGIELTARVLLEAGSPVWLEEPGYFGIQNALRLSGARMIPVPVDDEGLVVSAGIERAPRVRAAYVTPSHQFPMGVTMSASRRLRLLDWAQSTGAWIVEDDYDSEYRFGSPPITSLQGLDRDSRVIYIGTFTKILFPAMRIAYVVIPPDLVPAFVAVRRAIDMFSPPFFQAVLTDFIREGHFARHVRQMRLLCAERRETLVAALERERSTRLRVVGDAAGMFLTASLPSGTADREIALAATREGIKVMPLSFCALETPARRGVVLGYGGSKTAEIADGAARLAAILRRMRPRSRSRSR
jgi:GntR family transcriptional regulator/MocR family aminotransferase